MKAFYQVDILPFPHDLIFHFLPKQLILSTSCSKLLTFFSPPLRILATSSRGFLADDTFTKWSSTGGTRGGSGSSWVAPTGSGVSSTTGGGGGLARLLKIVLKNIQINFIQFLAESIDSYLYVSRLQNIYVGQTNLNFFMFSLT